MKKRLITALWLVPVFALIVFWGTMLNNDWKLNSISDKTQKGLKWGFFLTTSLIAAYAGYEATNATIKKGKWTFLFAEFGIFSCFFMNFSSIFSKDTSYIVTCSIVGALFLIPITISLFKNSGKKMFKPAMFVSFVGLSIKFLMLIIINLGWPVLIFILLIPIASDTFAYFGGIKYGKRKLAPTISPKKSIEGAIFGIVFGTIIPVSWLIGWYYISPESFQKMTYNIADGMFKISDGKIHIMNKTNILIVMSLVVPVFSAMSMMGDLAFSMIKRQAGIKDFSKILSEHGGILDRLDSVSVVVAGFAIVNTIIWLAI